MTRLINDLRTQFRVVHEGIWLRVFNVPVLYVHIRDRVTYATVTFLAVNWMFSNEVSLHFKSDLILALL